MAIDYAKLKARAFPVVEQSYTWKDSALYALSVGYASDPLDERELPFVYEQGEQAQVAAPTMPVVLATPGFWARQPDTGIDWVNLLHGEQDLVIHEPIPVAATVVSQNKITAIIDKGRGKGAIIVQERALTDKQTGKTLATLESLSFCRGDGGFSESGRNGPVGGDAAPTPKPVPPSRAPDHVVDLGTLAQSALFYRLCADPNPLHADPRVAKAAGFPRPILHGLASFAIAGHALVQACCGHDPRRLKRIGLRFSSPVFPGETLRTEIWAQPERHQFRVTAVERGVVVLNNGVAHIA
jgi:acyl dehydratase